jgi:hypothetical protein
MPMPILFSNEICTRAFMATINFEREKDRVMIYVANPT